MIFGVGTGDIILCASLAHRVWKESRDAPNDFQNVSTEVASFKLVLDEVRQLIAEREIGHSKQAELAELVAGCNHVLVDLQELLGKYRSLATQSKRTRDRLRWGQEHIERIRSRLVSHTSLLTSFNPDSVGKKLLNTPNRITCRLTQRHPTAAVLPVSRSSWNSSHWNIDRASERRQ